MARAELLQPFILRWEGGFVNDPLDSGGATNKGVTIGTFRRHFGRFKTVEDLKNITEEQWFHVFKSGYWDPCLADFINDQSIANIIVDWTWCSGARNACRRVQKVLGVTPDGIFGQQTLAAINARRLPMERRELFMAIRKERIKFIESIIRRNPSQKRFYRGWMNRIEALDYE